MATPSLGRQKHREKLVRVHDLHIRYNLDTDRIDGLSPADRESDGRCLPKCSVTGSGHRPPAANAGGGKKRRIWPRNHLSLKCAQVAEMEKKYIN